MPTRAWSETIPADTDYAGDGDDRIVETKEDLAERLTLDHNFNEASQVLDPANAGCEGYHKKVTLKGVSADPTPLTGSGVVYAKLVDGVYELFFRDATTGAINQLTEQGVISLNTLQNNIDGNGKNITNVGTLEVTTALVLPQGASVAPTAEGNIAWDSDDDRLKIGTGTVTKEIIDTNSVQTLSNKVIDSSCAIKEMSGNTLRQKILPLGYWSVLDVYSGATTVYIDTGIVLSKIRGVRGNIIADDQSWGYVIGPDCGVMLSHNSGYIRLFVQAGALYNNRNMFSSQGVNRGHIIVDYID